jgi:O-antigen ligase
MHSKKGLPFIKAVLPSLGLNFWVGAVGIPFGLIAGLLAAIQPRLLMAAMVAPFFIAYFFADFERTVLGLLILRSSLDIFTARQVPAAFAVGLNALTLLYVTVRLLTGQRVHTDRFWCFFMGWGMLQGLWLLLLPLGALGLDASFLSASLREWIRIGSFPVVYLLVMQLKGRMHPHQVILRLFLSLISPLVVALIQRFRPSLIPIDTAAYDITNRIGATFGHPNSFAVYLLLFIGLTWWQLGQTKQRWPWFILLGLLMVVLASTRTMVALAMLAVIVLVLIAPKLSLIKLVGGTLMVAAAIGLVASSEYGRTRLESIANTPLFNPDIDISRAILMSQHDMNSFNWRLGQWYELLQSWQQHPILGHGLGLSIYVADNRLLPHNDYVRALVEGGIVGLVLLLSLLVAQVWRLVQLMRQAPRDSAQRHLCIVLLAIAIAIPLGMATENIQICTAFFFYWWVVVAIAGWDWQEAQPLNQPFSEARSLLLRS